MPTYFSALSTDQRPCADGLKRLPVLPDPVDGRGVDWGGGHSFSQEFSERIDEGNVLAEKRWLH